MTHLIKFLWGDRRGSNSRQPVPQTGALPTELRSPYLLFCISGVSEEIRTPDPRLRRALLYPAELQTQEFGAGNEGRTRDIQLGRLTLYQLSYSRRLMVGIARFELAAPCSQGRCATGLRYIPTPFSQDKNDYIIYNKNCQYFFLFFLKFFLLSLLTLIFIEVLF